jgi:hypothetical protein
MNPELLIKCSLEKNNCFFKDYSHPEHVINFQLSIVMSFHLDPSLSLPKGTSRSSPSLAT